MGDTCGMSAPLAPIVMTIRDSACHPCDLIAYISGFYLSFSIRMAFSMHLSRVNVNYNICMVWVGIRDMGPGCS